jgi:cytochrome c biogenesis protein
MEPFWWEVNEFVVDWINSGPRQGMARGFKAHLTYRDSPTSPEKSYDLRVNHPLSIGGSQIFLIGHGYAPVVTIRDGSGHIAYSGPTIFLPENSNFLSFGVVKAPDAQPKGIGLEGLFYPTYLNVKGDPINVMGDLKNPTLSLLAYTGDLGMDNGTPQSVYVLDKSHAHLLKKPDGSMFRVDLQRGQSIKLPEHAGTVTFDGVDRWNRIQISRTPGTGITLVGVLAALLGMLGSLFIRPRRVWVRVRRDNGGPARVELAGLDRNDGGDVAAELARIMEQLGTRSPEPVTAGTKETT